MPLIYTISSLKSSGFNQNYTYTLSGGEAWKTQVDGTGGFTFEGWIYPRSTNAGRFFTFGNRFALYWDNTQNVEFLVRNSGGAWVSLLSTGLLPLNDWSHLTYTWDSSQDLSFYKNGVFSADTGPRVNFDPMGANDIMLGVPPAEVILGQPLQTNPLLITFSEFRMYNKALSAAEITAQWNVLNDHIYRTTDDAANLAACWPMNEGAGTSLADQTASTTPALPVTPWTPLMTLNEAGTGLVWVFGSPGATAPSANYPPELTPTTNTYITDYFSFDDNLGNNRDPDLSEDFSFLDEVSSIFLYNSTNINDYISFSDDIYGPRGDADVAATVKTQIRAVSDTENTVKAQIRERIDAAYTVTAVIKPNSMAPITSATNPANPTAATYIQNGTVVYSSSATLPAGDISKAKCFVAMKCANLIGPRSASEIFSFGLKLENGGGSWQANTTTDVGNYFDQVSIFGFNGTIIDKGFDWSSSSAGVVNGGPLGPAKFNKTLGFLTYGNPNYFHNVPNPSLATPQQAQYKTHRDAAEFLAGIVGATLSWAIPDRPLVNFQPQMNQTAIQAIASLATECGGILRWTGNSTYIVTYPDISLGTWTVPDCCLLIGLSRICTADVNTGLYNPGVMAVPQLGQYNAGITGKNFVFSSPAASGAGGSGGGAVASQNLTIIKDELTFDMPRYYIDLPYDFDTVYIQNVVTSDGNGPYTTQDPTRFWPLQAGFGGKYIGMVDVGGILKPVLHFHPDMFPHATDNADVRDKKWYMKIDVTTKPLSGGGNNNSDTEARTLLAYQFIPVCVGTIRCAFFGSIPVPGMYASATLGGKTVSGIVESVDFSNPGILTVRVIQWLRLTYYTHLASFDNTSVIPVVG